jgi:ABC-type glycerol-3-phosphate transport system permease component
MRTSSSRRYTRTLLLIVASLLVVAFTLLPFYWVLFISLMPEDQNFGRAVHLLPDLSEVTLANYSNLFVVLPFGKYLRNSAIVAVSTTIIAALVTIPAAYAFARFRFRGRRPMLLGMLALYMIPGVVLLVPLIVLFSRLKIMDTFPGLIIAESTGAIPFGVWLLINYFAALPRELEDAAQVDGCTRLGALFRIVLPLALPGVVAAGLFVFIGSWNDFTFAFIFAGNENVKTVPVVMRAFMLGEGGVFWGTVMSSLTIATLPVAALFLLFQKYLIGSLAAGAVRG